MKKATDALTAKAAPAPAPKPTAPKPVFRAGRVSVTEGTIRMTIEEATTGTALSIDITPGKMAELLEAVPWHRILERDATDAFHETREALLEMEEEDEEDDNVTRA